MRVLRTVFVLFVLAAAGAAAFAYFAYQRFKATPLAVEPVPEGAEPATVDVAPGTPFNRIVADLTARGVTRAHRWHWRALAWEMRVAQRLHAGEYALEPGMTPRTLLSRMAGGEVVQRRFTIVEGWTFRELRAALARAPRLAQTIGALSDEEVMAKLGAPGVHPEGRFLPETYAYTKGSTDLELLQRAYGAMSALLTRLWETRPADTPLGSPDQALTLASIVEKETGVASERPRIAGVFSRRLALGMLLQTDPTVIYGLGPAFDGNLTRAHLEADTPYNTYTRAGLPPTPIAMPGREALEAAVAPAPGNELYFVARGDGSHEFAATLAEHARNVAKYQLQRR
jgi:UPF0755 protein